MSNIITYDLKKNKLVKNEKYNYNKAKQFICNNSFSSLGINVIKTDFYLNDNCEKIEFLGYDESYKLVLIEFRKDRLGALVQKGFMIMNYITNNIGKTKVFLKDYLSLEVVNNLNFEIRLVIIGEDFSEYDYYAIKQTSCEVDLIKVKLTNEYVILDKTYQSYREQIKNKDKIINELFWKVHEYIMLLGDEVNASGNESFITYRLIKNLLYICIDKNITLNIRTKNGFVNYEVKEEKDLNKVFKAITSTYEEL